MPVSRILGTAARFGYDVASTVTGTAAQAAFSVLDTAVNALNPRFTDNDLAQSKYDFNYRIFPNDLGMDDNGHYMIIFQMKRI